MLGKYIGKSSKTIYEGARTLPRPTRHPLNLNNWLIPISSSYSGQTMNQFVDIPTAFVAEYLRTGPG